MAADSPLRMRHGEHPAHLCGNESRRRNVSRPILHLPVRNIRRIAKKRRQKTTSAIATQFINANLPTRDRAIRQTRTQREGGGMQIASVCVGGGVEWGRSFATTNGDS